jgi:hypothetical protein
MPDPTLTRYRSTLGTFLQVSDGAGIAQAYFCPTDELYRCEEADRLIQALRQEVEIARELIRKDAAFQEWAQSYLYAGRWAGHDRSDAIKTELLERDAEVGALRRALDAAQETIERLTGDLSEANGWHAN